MVQRLEGTFLVRQLCRWGKALECIVLRDCLGSLVLCYEGILGGELDSFRGTGLKKKKPLDRGLTPF